MPKQKLINYYWILFSLIQVYLIIEKIRLEEFLIWNIVALLAAAVFIYNRFRSGRVLKSYEQIILVFFIFNCISSMVYQIGVEGNLMKLVLIPILAIASVIVIYLLKDVKERKT